MIVNFLKVALRNIKKGKLFAFINIIGLAAGITAFLLITSYVKYEIEYDTFHKDAENIFRVVMNVSMRDGSKMNTCLTSPKMAEYLKTDFPQIRYVSRLFPAGNTQITYEDKSFYENAFWFVDSCFFDVFDFKLIKGDQHSLLSIRNSVVMTESVAEKYFGKENPIGKTVTIDKHHDFTVTGVVQNLPPNSHIRFEVLAYNPSFRSFSLQNWGALSLYTYVKLSEPALHSEIEAGLEKFIAERMGEPFPELFDIHLEPMLSIHLHSEREHDFSARTDSDQIYLLSVIAFLIVFVACINFMNLSTARSSTRSREIGVRKVLGASRKELVIQHLGESLLLTFLAVLISVVLYILLIPELNELSGTEITVHSEFLISVSLLTALVVGFFSGTYPALVLSSFNPVNILKKSVSKNSIANYVRKGLVLFQFAVTIGLLASALIVYSQMNFLRNSKLGFSKEEVLCIPIRDDEVIRKIEVLKNSLLQNSMVKNVSVTSAVPGYPIHQRGYNLPDSSGHSYILYTIYSDENYVNTLKLNIISGRNFSEDYSTDSETALLVNESLVKKFGWKDPIGKELTWAVDAAMNDTTRVVGKVVGVVEDFYFQSMFNKIEPLVIRHDNESQRILSLNINTTDIFAAVNSVQLIWNTVCTNIPFTSNFLNETYDNLYLSEQRLGRLFVVFTVIAIVISCLGLLGLSTFTVERKVKEIGIRKVLGASVINIVTGLFREFSFWILLANLVAWPITYYIMKNWLEKFEYRIGMTPLPFILAGVTAFIISLFVVAINSSRAAVTNPANSLRSE